MCWIANAHIADHRIRRRATKQARHALFALEADVIRRIEDAKGSVTFDGERVTGVDLDEGKIGLINEGRSPIIEPGLDELMRNAVKTGRLRGVRDAQALGEVCIVCVGTPSNGNGSLCLDVVRRVAEQIGCALRRKADYFVVAVRSTSTGVRPLDA